MFPLLIPAVPLTGTISTNYWYWQYHLPVLAVPLTGIGSINKLKFFDTAFRNFLLYFGFWESAFGFPLAKVADRQNKLQRTQSLSTYHANLHESFGTNFGYWLLAFGKIQTASAESQRLIAKSQSKKEDSRNKLRDLCVFARNE